MMQFFHDSLTIFELILQLLKSFKVCDNSIIASCSCSPPTFWDFCRERGENKVPHWWGNRVPGKVAYFPRVWCVQVICNGCEVLIGVQIRKSFQISDFFCSKSLMQTTPCLTLRGFMAEHSVTRSFKRRRKTWVMIWFRWKMEELE